MSSIVTRKNLEASATIALKLAISPRIVTQRRMKAKRVVKVTQEKEPREMFLTTRELTRLKTRMMRRVF